MANQYKSRLAGGAAGTGGDALPTEVLTGKTFTNDDGAQTGTMPNRGAVSGTASSSNPYVIPEGYHNGEGTVTAVGTFPSSLTFGFNSSGSDNWPSINIPSDITDNYSTAVISRTQGSATASIGGQTITNFPHTVNLTSGSGFSMSSSANGSQTSYSIVLS